MLSWAQRSTPPGCSKALMSAGARSAAPTRYGGGVPTTVSVRTRAGRRAAKARAIVPPILAPIRWKRSTPRVSIRRQKSSMTRSRVQGNSRGMGVEAPKPRMSGRTTRYQGARCGTRPYHATPLSALPWSMRTVAGGRRGRCSRPSRNACPGWGGIWKVGMGRFLSWPVAEWLQRRARS